MKKILTMEFLSTMIEWYVYIELSVSGFNVKPYYMNTNGGKNFGKH